MASLCDAAMEFDRAFFVQAVCAVAEGADPAAHAAGSVLAALRDPLRRVCVLGGREGLERSVGSVYACSITLFLCRHGGLRRPAELQLLFSFKVKPERNGMAFTRDGTKLLVADHSFHGTISVIRASDGALLQVIGFQDGDRLGFCIYSPHVRDVAPPRRPLRFVFPSQVFIAEDDHVFVADCGNSCVQELSPLFQFRRFLGGRDMLHSVHGVCASAEKVFVAAGEEHGYIAIFSRASGALLLTTEGRCQVGTPSALCLMADKQCIAVAGASNIYVISDQGTMLRTIPYFMRKCLTPHGLACSAAGELVVSTAYSYCRDCITVFDRKGAVALTVKTPAHFPALGLTIHAGAIYAQTFTAHDGERYWVPNESRFYVVKW